MRVSPFLFVCFSYLILLGSLSAQEKLTDAEVTFFESKIRPVLAKHCYQCHSAKQRNAEGNLALDTKAGTLQGGDRGQAIVPKDLKKSLLIEAISYEDPDFQMPPKDKKLSDQVIADFKRWIEMGAPDPRTEKIEFASSVNIEEGRKFWSFQKPVKHPLPQVKQKDWPKKALDHFVLHALETNQLSPSADANSETLLRRVYFDLIGLPPTPEQLKAFQTNIQQTNLDQALAKEVDTLLTSDQFGERWGRHWLDVARFAESSGKETNVTFPHAWRYRDYVIESFQDDKPFDLFLTEQIAGDLLPYETDAQREKLLIATGFLAIGPKGLNEMNRLQFLADLVDEQIDTVSRAVMANTIACARCHDHKYDPYSMEDYYSLAGIFASSVTHFGTSVAPGNQIGGTLIELPKLEKQLIPNLSIGPKRREKLAQEFQKLIQEEKDRKAKAFKAAQEGKDPIEFFSLADALRIIWRKGAITGSLQKVDKQGNALPLTMGVVDRKIKINSPIFKRGEITKPGETVNRKFPQVIQLDDAIKIPQKESGRLQLAQWLTQADHPLTARVMVNRIWKHLIGNGLVRTMDNFGMNGEPPTHPELLDHLAIQFIENGWSTKYLIREIILSKTYRQGSGYVESAFLKDPENRFIWRANKRRLDAEAIRDAMLAVSGNLNREPRKGSLIATIGDKPVSIIGFDRRVPADMDNSRHRSVYLPVIRDRLPDVLDLFDFAEPSLVTGKRETTNVPLQALYLMNSPFVQDQSTALSVKIRQQTDSLDQQIKLAFVLCFSRPPDEQELKIAKDFFINSKSEDLPPSQAFAQYCQGLLCAAEFRNLD